MKHKNRIGLGRIDRIFYGELEGEQEDLIQNREHRFAYVFLLLTKLQTGSVTPIDEARLDTVADRLEYLKNVEGVDAGTFDLDFNWFREESAPFIGFRGKERIPVLLRFRHGRWRMLNPEDGSECRVTPEVAGEIAGNSVFILPRSSEAPKDGWHLLLDAAWRQKTELGLFLLLTLAATAISSGLPSMVGFITTALVPNRVESGILVIAISLALVVLAVFLINTAVNRIKIRMETGMGSQALAAILSRIMRMNAGTEKRLSGRIIALLMPFISSVTSIVTSFLGGFVFLVQTLMVLFVTDRLGQRETDIIYALALGEVLVILLMQIRTYRKTVRVRDSEARLSAIRREILDNIEVIRTGAIEDRILYRFAVEYDNKMRMRLSIDGISLGIGILGTLVSSVGVFIIFAHFALNRELDTGSVAVLISSFTLMVSYLNSTAMSFAEVAAALPHLKLADQILAAPTEISDSGAADRVITGRIELDHVTFAYSESANPVIRNLSLTIEPGEYVGIVGSSGCGKSTLMNLMMGLLSPTEGHIYYDGIEMGQYNLKSLRRQFGVVLQDAAIITGSIRQNIGLSADADLDAVREAARAAAVLEEIEKMPMQFNTLLSGEAEVISGGQRQRIVLARALMRRPRILFLDEATSAVDNLSQKTIREHLDRMGITRVAIAHRLSTVINCDRIIVLNHGVIAEQGTYQELMRRNGLFAKMARRNLMENEQAAITGQAARR